MAGNGKSAEYAKFLQESGGTSEKFSASSAQTPSPKAPNPMME